MEIPTESAATKSVSEQPGSAEALKWEPGAWAEAYSEAVAEHIKACCRDHEPPPFPPGVTAIQSPPDGPFSCPLCGVEFDLLIGAAPRPV